jgi:hypothetical protein
MQPRVAPLPVVGIRRRGLHGLRKNVEKSTKDPLLPIDHIAEPIYNVSEWIDGSRTHNSPTRMSLSDREIEFRFGPFRDAFVMGCTAHSAEPSPDYAVASAAPV